jgi:anti-sigma regulatory factor (Ser/Thr protein kinase)
VSFRHGALFYDGEEEFLAGTVDFIREGVRAGEPALVVVDAPKIDAMRSELNGDADGVRFLDMQEVGQNPARIIPVWREFVDANVGPHSRARGIGEPIWAARSAAELTECQRHESLLNLAFDGGHGWSLLCPYDTGGLDDDVLEEARRSHPILADGTGEHASPAYDADAARHPFSGELPEPAGPTESLRYGVGDIAEVRHFVERYAARAGLAPERVDDLVLAVSELATNTVRHATGTGVVRVWSENGTLLCEVSDSGLIDEPLVGRVLPSATALGGRGIWIVNQLCDLVQVRSSEQGTTIRLHMKGYAGAGAGRSLSAISG